MGGAPPGRRRGGGGGGGAGRGTGRELAHGVLGRAPRLAVFARLDQVGGHADLGVVDGGLRDHFPLRRAAGDGQRAGSQRRTAGGRRAENNNVFSLNYHHVANDI